MVSFLLAIQWPQNVHQHLGLHQNSTAMQNFVDSLGSTDQDLVVIITIMGFSCDYHQVKLGKVFLQSVTAITCNLCHSNSSTELCYKLIF